jgi:hypothetical protein
MHTHEQIHLCTQIMDVDTKKIYIYTHYICLSQVKKFLLVRRHGIPVGALLQTGELPE